MSNNLNIRLSYMGGKKADDRMALDKLKTLKKALLYSYQSETIVLEDGREFRALINPDKLKNDYDNKILSIPFEDICLNSEFQDIPTSMAEEPTNMQVGDVFYWKETNTHWLVYLRYLEESAYFRAEIRKCSSIVTIDGKNYYAYIRGPVETSIKWNNKSDIVWNSINYSKVAYVREDDETRNLARFDVVQVDGKNFEVQAVNKDTASDGIMIIYLSEDYTNSIKEQVQQIEEPKEEIISDIQGETEVYPYDIKTYTINAIGGAWTVSNKKARILKQTETEATVEFTTGRAGEVDIVYIVDGNNLKLPVTIKSF